MTSNPVEIKFPLHFVESRQTTADDGFVECLFVGRKLNSLFRHNLIYSLRLSSDSARKELIRNVLLAEAGVNNFSRALRRFLPQSLSRKSLRLPTKSSRQITEACRILRVMLSVIWWWHKMFVCGRRKSRGLIFNVLFSAPPPDAEEHSQLPYCRASQKMRLSKHKNLKRSIYQRASSHARVDA